MRKFILYVVVFLLVYGTVKVIESVHVSQQVQQHITGTVWL